MADMKQEFDWKTMTHNAKMKYLETAVHDCSFAVGKTSEDIKAIKSYKRILASVSPVFDRMFNGDFLESHAAEGIPVTGADAKDWQMFQHYIFYGELPSVVCNKTAKLNIYWLAKKYEVEIVKTDITSGMLDSFTGADPAYYLFKALAIAVDCKDDSLKSNLQNAINRKNAKRPLWGSFIYDVDKDTFCAWLQCEHSNTERYNYIDFYAKINGLKRSVSGGGPLERMLKFVDFSSMDAAIFREGPLYSDVLTTDEKDHFWRTTKL